MPSNDWLLSPIEIKSLERARVEEVAPSHLHFWRFYATGAIRLLSEPMEIPGIDIVALPTGKFLQEGFANVLPEHDRIRTFAHLAEVPPRPRLIAPTLIDAPDNPNPAPAHNAEVVELVPKASPDPLRPKGVDIDRDAVLLDLAAHRAKQPDRPIKEKARELLAAYRAKSQAREETRIEELPSEPQPARMLAFAPQWRSHS